MFIPISDDNSDRKIIPFVNYVFIAINIIVFFIFQKFGTNYDFTYAFSTVPAEIITGKDIITQASKQIDIATGNPFTLPGLRHTPISVYLTLITGIFMHGGLAHLGGNLLYLFIFGDNIENRLGHVKFFFFYLLCGGLASLSHVFATYFQGSSTLIPCLGASGAISAMLGAYVFLFPQNKVRILLFYFPILVPAFIALGAWIIFQVISGLGFLGGSADGVAYGAHIGGFVAGFILISFFASKKSKMVAV
jgi:membrane associated rhomboid family serine protease